MKLAVVYILFSCVEYVLRIFVDSYKYHTSSPFFESLPLIVLSIVSVFIYRKEIIARPFGKAYVKLIFASIAGLLTAKAILFFQWYWILAPEYRDVPGDMGIALGFTFLYFVVSALVIMFSYLFGVTAMRHFLKAA